jgi:hypothetical protein
MDMVERQRHPGRPVRSACLVAGCGCKDARIISTRRAAFFAAQAKAHGETADRTVDPEPSWRWVFAPLPIFEPVPILASSMTVPAPLDP